MRILFALYILVFSTGSHVMASENVRTVQEDRSDISQVVYRWGFYRDHGMWDELLDTFHPDGDIQVTWYAGKFTGFVEESKRMAESGAASSHVFKPPIIDIVGDRAIAIAPTSITARANPGIELDMTSHAYFLTILKENQESGGYHAGFASIKTTAWTAFFHL